MASTKLKFSSVLILLLLTQSASPFFLNYLEGEPEEKTIQGDESSIVCNVKVVMDNAFYRLMSGDDEAIAEFASSVFDAANAFFRQSGPRPILEDRGRESPVQFKVGETFLATDEFCDESGRRVNDYRCFFNPSLEVLDLGLKRAEDLRPDGSRRCLTYLLSGHDLAPVGGQAKYLGACVEGKWDERSHISPFARRARTNYNVGVVSVGAMGKYGEESRAAEAARFLAHELAHSLGSDHDGAEEVDEEGRPYIMAAAYDGSTPWSFSPSSADQMSRNLVDLWNGEELAFPGVKRPRKWCLEFQ